MSPETKSVQSRPLLTISEAAAYLRLSKSAVYKKVESRDLTFYRVGRRLLFNPADLDKWLESQRVEAM